MSKAVTIVYVILGIPLVYLFVTNLGQHLSGLVTACLNKISVDTHNPITRKKNNCNNSNSGGNALNKSRDEALGLTALTGSRRSTWQTKGGAGTSSQQNGLKLENANDGMKKSLTKSKFIPIVLVCIVIMFVYMLCGALILSESQDWEFSDSFFFCFMALLTIGFGDIRPTGPHLWPCIFYVFFSLAILATCYYLLRNSWPRGSGRCRRRRKRAGPGSGSSSVVCSQENIAKRNWTRHVCH